MQRSSARRAAPVAARLANFDDFAAAAAARFDGLPPQLQRIARYALDAPEDFALGTVAQLAQAIGVQPSALVRFANAFGCGGFAPLRALFRARLVARNLSYRERIERLARDPQQPLDTPVHVLRSQVHDGVTALRQLEDEVTAAQLEQAARLIAAARQVHLLAARRSFPVASYLAYALNQLERRVALLDGVGGMNREFGVRIGTDELLVAVSFRSYTQEVVDIAAAAHARSVPVIAITDSPLSPLAAHAQVAFLLGDDRARPFRSLVAPVALAQTLVLLVGRQLTTDARGNGGAGAAKPARGARAGRRR